MRVLLTCGGTGGHITPALAIADLLKKWDARTEILFAGTEKGMEKEMIAAAGYPMEFLSAAPFPRHPGFSVAKNFCTIREGVKEGKALIAAKRPDIVIGTGGYVCYPALRAAAAMGVKTAVHESNAVPGLAVRMLARRVDRIWLNFQHSDTKGLPKNKVRFVGNPVSFTVENAKPLPFDCQLKILSFGGSLGAEKVNEAVLSLMEKEGRWPHIAHVHATGKREYETFMKAFHERGLVLSPRLRVEPFIHDMGAEMASATVVICRAGAMSISEIAMAGKAAVLIPSPNVTGNHQYKNAKLLAENGAAVLIPESELQGRTLSYVVERLLLHEEEREKMCENIRAFATPDANRAILEDILKLTKKS